MPKSPKKSQSQESTVKEVVDKFKACWSYTSQNHHPDWDDYYKLYRSIRTDHRSYHGIADTFDPMTFSTTETILAGLSDGDPQWNYTPTRDDQKDETDVLNSLVTRYWEQDQWDTKTITWIRNMLIYGTGVIMIYWDIDRPRILNIPVRDFIFDPTAANPDDARYMGRRYLTTVEELKEAEMVDPETGKLVNVFKNLGNINKSKKTGGKDSDENLDKDNKDMFLGSTLGDDAARKQVEVIEIWTEDKVYSVANRSVLIQEDDNPYKTRSIKRGEEEQIGLMPFIVQRNYPDESLLLGISEIAAIMKPQEQINDVNNQNMDAQTKALQRTAYLDPEYMEYIDEIELGPDSILPFGKEGFGYHDAPTVGGQGFAIVNQLKDNIRETTASSEIVKGAGPTSGDITATEANLQVSQADLRTRVKIKQLEKDGFHRLAKLVFRLIQLFVDDAVMVRVAQSQGVDFVDFNPEEFLGEYEPRVKLQSSVQAEKQQTQTEALQMYELLSQNPNVNMDALNKILLPKVGGVLSKDDVEDIFSQPELPVAGGIDPSLDPNAPGGIPPELPGLPI